MTRWETFRNRHQSTINRVDIVFGVFGALLLAVIISWTDTCAVYGQVDPPCLIGLTPGGEEPTPGVPTDVCTTCACSETTPSLTPFTQEELARLVDVLAEEDIPPPPPLPVPVAAITHLAHTTEIDWVCGPPMIKLQEPNVRVAIAISLCVPRGETMQPGGPLPEVWRGRTTPAAKEPVYAPPTPPETKKRGWAIPSNIIQQGGGS